MAVQLVKGYWDIMFGEKEIKISEIMGYVWGKGNKNKWNYLDFVLIPKHVVNLNILLWSWIGKLNFVARRIIYIFFISYHGDWQIK